MSQIPALHCHIVKNVTLLPMVGDITGQVIVYAQGAFDEQKNPLPYVRRMIHKDTAYYYQLPYIKPWHKSTQEVIYGGIFFMHWGHFLLEDLQRLWYAKQSNLPIVWTGVNGFSHTPSEFKSWQSEIFRALGINNEHIFLKEPTQFAKVHFPEPGVGINTHLHPEHVEFLGYYESTPIKSKYVYFSRSKIRSCANEEQVENLLKKRGWQVVYPEDMTVAKQLKTMASAEVCFMIGGSAQHTMLLAKNLKTRFIIIPREHTETFNLIANHKSDNYFLLNMDRKVLYSDNLDEANDLFTIDLEILGNVLEKTKDFTTNFDAFSALISKPSKLSEKNLKVPDFYYEKPKPLSKARKLFYKAYFFYLAKNYNAAHNIFIYMYNKNMLDDSMYIDFFNAVQRYHIQNQLGISLPLKKHRYHIDMLRTEIAKNPQNLRRYKKLSDYLLIEGNFESALNLQEKLCQLNPEWSKPLAQMAYIYDKQNNLPKAIECAQRAMEVEPHKLKRKSELVNYLLKNKDFSACKTILTEGLRQNPTWDEAYVLFAKVHHAQGQLDKAIACVQKAVDMAPNNLSAQEELADYLGQQGKKAAAVQILAKALQNNPRPAERYAQNARIYELKGDMAKAVEYAYKAVEMEPRNFVCKTHLATYLIKHKDYAAAKKIMTEAMHRNPFWSEPHVQFAAICEAKGELDAAINHSRKAFAMEPFNGQYKQELENYRITRIQQNTPEEDFLTVLNKRHSPARARIQSYIDIFYASTYLEIGVFQGSTFLNIDVPYKIGVDPAFQFNPDDFANENTVLYSETSDEFFEKFKQRAKQLNAKYHNKDFKFDVIFIDGLHTFEQTLRDFENSIAYSHENTIWIIDDTIPSNHFSAIASQEKSEQLKACAGISKESAWHGDVFKAIFAIHDTYPEFSYCTQVNNANPQTILWRTEKPTKRKKVFENSSIAKMRYEDFLEHAWVMYPVQDEEVIRNIFLNINPLDYKDDEEYKRVIRPIISDRERQYAKENRELNNKISKLAQEQVAIVHEIEKLNAELLEISKQNNALSIENSILKKHLNSINS